jgi:flavocytochrome c
MAKQVIVVGGGLSGLSAVHTILEHGGNVLLLDKNGFLGGNSTKAISGINGALTRTQIQKGIPDSVEKFMEDTALSASKGKSKEIYPLGRAMVEGSGPAVDWLQSKFKLDLSLVGRLGGHSFPRTHRGKERFPGMTITYALMEAFEEVCEKKDGRGRLITKARVNKLLTGNDGSVIGCQYEKDGKTFSEYGPVILATGGYGADFTENSLIKKHRPDLMGLPTTNGEHCTGDGIKLAQEIGGDLKDIEFVQVHPTGLVHPDEPNAKVKFLAAEALRGTGGILLDANGKRFADELGRRDYVTGEMWKGKQPFRLALNSASAKEIEWHCKHYQGRGLMKRFENGKDFAKDIGISPEALKETFDQYNKDAKQGSDTFGKKFFQNAPYSMDDYFYVAIVCPVVHYCMGGVAVNPLTEVITTAGKSIPGLYAAGEIMGGTHGQNRLGGSSLLDCVVFGRVAGAEASKYLLQHLIKNGGSASSASSGGSGSTTTFTFDSASQKLTVQFGGSSQSSGHQSTAAAPASSSTSSSDSHPDAQLLKEEAAAKGGKSSGSGSGSASAAKEEKTYTLEEVAKHNKEDDCWVAVNGQVLNVTKFLPDHPGGARSILLYAGKDASEEFNMLHKPEVVQKYAPYAILGKLAPKSKL